MADENIRDVWTIDTSGAVEGLRKLKDETEKAEHAQKSMSDFLKEDLEKSLLSAHAQYEMLKEAVKAVGEFVMESSHKYLENAEISARMTVTLRNMGYEAEQLVRHFEAEATALAKVTGKSDDYIGNLQNLIIGMGVGADQVDRFTEDALNLANLMGQDATTAARLLSRAHMEGKEELKRYGIVVDDVKFSHQGFTHVLEEVEKRVHGINDEMPEAIKRTREYGVAWEEVQKKAGKFFTETLTAYLTNSGVGGLLHMMAGDTEKIAANFNKINGDEGKVRTLTMPVFDLSAEANKMAADAKKADQADEAQLKHHLMNRKEMYDAAAKVEDARKKEALSQKEADLKAEDEAEAAIRAAEVSREEEKNNKLMAKVKEYTERVRVYREQKEAEEKAIWKSMTDSMIGYAKQVGSILSGMLKDAMVGDTQYTRAMFEHAVARETVGMKEEDAQKKRQQMEKQLAEDNKNTLLQKLADTLANVAIDSQIKAIMETANSLASLAEYDYGAAAAHGIAAAAYGAVAIAAGGAAIGISQSRGMTGSERSQLEASDKAATDRSKREAAQEAQRGKETVGTQISVYNLGITGQTDQEQGRELERIRRKYDDSKTGS